MCDCRKEIEAKLAEHHAMATPNGRSHSVTLKGYGIVLGSSVSGSAYMPYEASALVPLKSGVEKLKKTTGNMFVSFCPFCGVKVTP